MPSYATGHYLSKSSLPSTPGNVCPNAIVGCLTIALISGFSQNRFNWSILWPSKSMLNLTRRSLLRLIGGLTLSPMAAQAMSPSGHGFRIRTITAGVTLDSPGDLSPLSSAADFLDRARDRFGSAGYEVQTVRIATQELSETVARLGPVGSLDLLSEIDRLVADRDVLIAVGPLLHTTLLDNNSADFDFAGWASEMVAKTSQLSFSVRVAASDVGPMPEASRVAAETILRLSQIEPSGEQNFRFAASANVPAGTPFFPVAYHDGPAAFTLGLESAPLVTEAFDGATDFDRASIALKQLLETRLTPIVEIAEAIASTQSIRFGGIDLSPAPGLDASIGEAIETITGLPFGSPSTLAACAAVTSALASAEIPSCGYSGLMLPVLEDPVLAARAREKRFDLTDLLLYSSVCGTGLDVVPVPGDCTVEILAKIIGDVAAMSTKLRKPLAARLLPIPGKSAGEFATFDNPHLIDSAMIMSAL